MGTTDKMTMAMALAGVKIGAVLAELVNVTTEETAHLVIMAMEELLSDVVEVREFAEAHHGDQDPVVWLHGLTVDVVERLHAIEEKLVVLVGDDDNA